VSYTIEMVENDTAMLVSLGEDFDFATEGEAHFAKIISMLDQQAKPVFYIVDLRKVHFSFEETLAVVSRVARGEDPLLRHKNIKEIINVMGDAFSRRISEGLDSEPFGNLKVKIVDTLDEALKYIRSKQ